MVPSRPTMYLAMDGEPTVELRCPSRLECSIAPPPLPGALCMPWKSRTIGCPRVSSMITGHATALNASRPSRTSVYPAPPPNLGPLRPSSVRLVASYAAAR